MVRARNFVVTINNWTIPMLNAITAMPIITYGIMGEECGEEAGTDHLQGYVQLNQAQTISAFQKKLQKVGVKCYIAIAKGTPAQNFDYCSKEDETHEWGEMKKQGKRNDLKEIHDMIQGGASMKEIREEYPGDWYRYRRAFEEHRKQVSAERVLEEIKEEMKDVVLRSWQQDVVDKLLAQTNRQVLWVVDEVQKREPFPNTITHTHTHT